MCFAAIVEFVHDHGYFWLFHVGNGTALVVTLLALWLSWQMVQVAPTRARSPARPAGVSASSAEFGLLVNAINLLLILLEGSYIYFIRTGH